jgi:aspartyl-tRNA(Asn)/glutamyl-tRNA(Gln) amidotransferase subunit A
VQQEMLGALEGCDILVSPAAPTPAYPIGGKTSDPLSMYKEDLMTVSLNLSGLPAVVVPAGLTDRPGAGQLPVGVQMIGRMFGEAQLLAVAHAFEVTRGPLGASPPACAAAAAAAAAPAAALAV